MTCLTEELGAGTKQASPQLPLLSFVECYVRGLCMFYFDLLPLGRPVCMCAKSLQSCPLKSPRVGCHFFLQGDLPQPGIEPVNLKSPALAGRFFTTSSHLGCTREARRCPNLPELSAKFT